MTVLCCVLIDTQGACWTIVMLTLSSCLIHTQHTASNINHFFLMLYLKIWFPLSLAEIPYDNPCSIDFFLIADSTFPHLMFQNFLLYHNFISSVIGFRSSWSTRQSPLWSRFPKSFILAQNSSKDCWKWEFLRIANKAKKWFYRKFPISRNLEECCSNTL